MMPPATRKKTSTVIKRREKRILGIFIDGVGLDRATRRMHQKIEMSALVQSLSTGSQLAVCRYYTVIPHEDDSRQLAFLDAVAKAGLTVVVKRLPPKGITRQVTTDVEMAVDITAFSLGCTTFCGDYVYRPADNQYAQRPGRMMVPSRRLVEPREEPETVRASSGDASDGTRIRRIATVVCPTQETAYSISLANELGVDTVTADFANPRARNIMKSSAKWIDLSTSETIWRN